MKREVSVLVKPASGGDVDVDKAIEGVRREIRAKQALLDGAVLLEDVDLTTTDFARIAHSLKRRPRGYFISRLKTAPGAAFTLYDDNDNRTDADRFLYLRSIGASVTVDLVVF